MVKGGKYARKEHWPQLDLEKLDTKWGNKFERMTNVCFGLVFFFFFFAQLEETVKQPHKPPAPLDKETSAAHNNSVSVPPCDHSPERDTPRASGAAMKGKRA